MLVKALMSVYVKLLLCCIWVMCPSCCISQNTVLDNLHAVCFCELQYAVFCVYVRDSNNNFGSVFAAVFFSFIPL